MQTGHIYRKGDSWFLLFKEPQSVGGKKKWRNKVVKLTDVSDRFRTERSVRDAKLADEYLQSVVQTDEGSTQLVRDFIEHVYLKTIQRRPSTMNGYENIFTKHLKDRLGDIRMLDFRTSHGHKLLERIAQEEPHLAHSSLKHIKHFLNGVFTHALRQGTELPTGDPMRDAGIQRVWKARTPTHTVLKKSGPCSASCPNPPKLSWHVRHSPGCVGANCADYAGQI